jgi:hypothetical protein
VLTFDPATHTYRYDGKVVPGVTSLLAWACQFNFITADELDAARERGTYVHALTELDDLGDLDDEKERDGEHWPRLLAWRDFCAKYQPNWARIEAMGYSARFGFAGTPDREGVLEFYGRDPWIIDVKSSATPSRVWGLQTAAYRQIAAERDPRYALARRGTVRLLADGTHRFDEWKDPRDWPAFVSIINLMSWKNHA